METTIKTKSLIIDPKTEDLGLITTSVTDNKKTYKLGSSQLFFNHMHFLISTKVTFALLYVSFLKENYNSRERIYK